MRDAANASARGPALVMFRFLHAADLHLDSPLRGLQEYPGAPVEKLRIATREALVNLVKLAIEEEVAFVLIAGDVYDGDWQDYKTGLFFSQQMSRLNVASIPAFLISGNHDAQNKMTKELPLPENVHRFSHKKAETRQIEAIEVAIHGQSFAKAAVAENLARDYPPAIPGYFNIGVLHTSLTGSAEHDTYAPCKLEDLRAKDYDYWALGHIHKREIVQAADPVIAYSGNIQGRHIRETGPKGCFLVSVDVLGAATAAFRELDVLRWERCEVDVSKCETAEEAVDQITLSLGQSVEAADGRFLAARVELQGASPAHGALMARPEHWSAVIRDRATEATGEQVWVEKVKFRTAAPREAYTMEGDGPLGELSRTIEDLRSGVESLPELDKELAELKQKLAEALAGDVEASDFGGREWMGAMLATVEPLLSSRLMPARDQE